MQRILHPLKHVEREADKNLIFVIVNAENHLAWNPMEIWDGFVYCLYAMPLDETCQKWITNLFPYLVRAIPFEILRGDRLEKVPDAPHTFFVSSRPPPEDLKWNSPQLFPKHSKSKQAKQMVEDFVITPSGLC